MSQHAPLSRRRTWRGHRPGALVALASFALGTLLGCAGARTEEATTPVDLASVRLPWHETGIPRVQVPLDDAPGRGAPAPLVTMVVFSDFECSYCRDATPIVERLLEAYPDTLRFHFRHLPLPFHEHAALAAIAAEEARAQAGEHGFWRMHDRLFANPDALGPEDLVAHAEALGLDAERFAIALRGRVHADRVERDLEVADRVGADGTPSFYVNGRPVLGALPFEEFRLVIDRELQLARTALERGVPRAQIYEAAMREALAEAPRRRRAPPGGDAPGGRPDEASLELDPSVTFAIPVEGAPALGPADAPVTVVIFSDFECPFCARVIPTLHALLARYPDQLRLVFRHNPLPFHARAEVAAQAAIEAHAQRGDEGFWAMHDMLFANQRALRFDDLVSYASQQGLDLARFRAALEEGAHEPAIESDQRLARGFGARGTPTFFVNGRVVTGAQPIEVFVAAVDQARERAEAEAARGTPPAEIYAALTRSGATEAAWREREVRAPRAVIAPPDGAPRRGASDPRLVIQVFTDFQCPFCALVGPTVERLLREFPDVQLVYRSFPLPFHENATDAAIAAIEVQRQLGDEAFWRMYERLFENQRALSRPELMQHAAAVGADPARVGAALESRAHLPVVQADMQAIASAGLRIGTPAFLVGDRLVMGAQDYQVFEAAVRAALDEPR